MSHDDARNEQFSTPDAPRLPPLQRASQARLPNRAVQAQCLCLLDIGRRSAKNSSGSTSRQGSSAMPRGTTIGPPASYMSAYFSDHEVPLKAAPRIWPGNTKAVSPGCLGVTAWRRRCELHRRTTGGWSQTARELGVGDVVIAESGDTCALCVGCRSAGLKAELSPAAPADPVRDRLYAEHVACH